MARPKGSLNPDYDEKRQQLLERLRMALMADAPPSSYRELAEAALVTIPTLRHYFGNREAVFAAVFADLHAGALGELERSARPAGRFAPSMRQLAKHLAEGFEHYGLRALHGVGLVEGIRAGAIGSAYLDSILEPTIEAVGKRLEAHVERGEMRNVDTRLAAVGFVAPILVVFLHQHALGGASSYPMDLEAMVAAHVTAFVRAYEA